MSSKAIIFLVCNSTEWRNTDQPHSQHYIFLKVAQEKKKKKPFMNKSFTVVFCIKCSGQWLQFFQIKG